MELSVDHRFDSLGHARANIGDWMRYYNERRPHQALDYAIRIDAFRDVEEFKAELQEMAERVRNEPAIDPEIRRVMVPGDPEKTAWRERCEQGIPMPSDEWKGRVCVG